jgi:hypothetical protein
MNGEKLLVKAKRGPLGCEQVQRHRRVALSHHGDTRLAGFQHGGELFLRETVAGDAQPAYSTRAMLRVEGRAGVSSGQILEEVEQTQTSAAWGHTACKISSEIGGVL